MSTTALTTLRLLNNEAIAQNADIAIPVDLERSNYEGLFSLQIEIVSGTGVITGTFEISNNGGDDYITPTGSPDIMTAFAPAGGPNGDGKDIFSFDPPIGGKMQIRITETNVGPCVVNAWLAAQ